MIDGEQAKRISERLQAIALEHRAANKEGRDYVLSHEDAGFLAACGGLLIRATGETARLAAALRVYASAEDYAVKVESDRYGNVKGLVLSGLVRFDRGEAARVALSSAVTE